MRIYYIISSFHPLIGGAERATQNLCQDLAAQGYNVEVATTWYPGLTRHELFGGFGIRRMGFGGEGKLRSLLFGLHALWHLLSRGRPISLIHIQNFDTPLLVGIMLKLLLRKPLIATIHSDQVIPENQRKILGRIRLFFMRKLVDHFTTISTSGQEGMLGIGIPAEQITLIPNGLDTDFFRPPTAKEKNMLRGQYRYTGEAIIVLFLGRLIASKRVDLLLEALSELKQDARVKCIIVGDGPEKDALQDMSARLGLADKVEFVGATNKVRDFYWLSDIFVQPSQFEGLSVALIESMSCGMTVLVSQCAGNLDAVVDGENGLTFPVDDAQQLADRLKNLVSDPVYSTLGKRARSSVQATYAIPIVVKAHLEIYEKLLGQ